MLAAQASSFFLSLLLATLRPLSSVLGITATATRTSGSAALTAVGSLAGVSVGAVVTGTGITASPPTTVLAMDDAAHTATLSANATASGTSNLTFTNPGVLTALEMGLFTNVVNPTSATVLGDLTEPSYPGYARQAMTVNPVKIDALGNYINDYNSCHFQPTGTWVSGVPCLGYFVSATFEGGDVLLYTENFVSAIPLIVDTNSTDLLFDGYIPNQKVYGGLCASC